jgi:hypothetical protein
MFDFNVDDIPMESASGYGDTNAFMIGAMQAAQGLSTNIAKLAGFQTEEDLLLQIYDNADFDTEVGVDDVVQKVMAINPEKGAELQKMLTEKSIGRSQLATAKLATETAKLQNVMIKHGTKLNREFTMTPSDGGLKTTIGQWLIINNINTEGFQPSTYVGALKYVYQQYQDDTTFANQLRDDLKEQIATAKTAWVQAGALAILEGEEAPETYSAEETFTAPLLSDDKDWQAFLKFKEEEKKKKNKSSMAYLGTR